jgi:type 2A phosphatase activator TIP41
MKDCFFGLLRSYLRVDNVIVRIIDTRIFHSFGDNYLLRDFQVKESTFENLNSKGFKFSSEWSLSQGQSDMVSRYLDVVYAKKDKIYFDY